VRRPVRRRTHLGRRAAHIPDALALAASGGVDPGKVVSRVIDWEDLPAALPEKHLKPVFVRAGIEDGS
jgi:alcohol dehydrogenase